MSEAQEKPPRRVPRVAWVAMAAGAAVLLGVVGFILLRRRAPSEDPTAPLHAPAFTGDSAKLEHTVIVPTLETPMPPGKNVIWCLSFQVAWKRLKNDVTKEPIKVNNAQAVADRLNNAPQSEADLDPESFYAAAGTAPEVIARIQREMAAKFPTVPKPSIKDYPGSLIAYAYLQARVLFAVPYAEHAEGTSFRDSGGVVTWASGFGNIPNARGQEELCEQIGVLFSGGEHTKTEHTSFALDLCKTSQPDQLILASIPPGASLSETLADLERRLQAAKLSKDRDEFARMDVLLVPNLRFELTHHFLELEGKSLDNAAFSGWGITTAYQDLRFRLDRCGAGMQAEAKIEIRPAVPRRFVFDRPFLIVMKKRGAQHPFFVMWVDNAELLCKQ
jgi:hypothetical protein